MPPLARLNRKIQNKIQVNSIIQKSLRRNGNTGQDFAPLVRKIGGLDSVPAPNPAAGERDKRELPAGHVLLELGGRVNPKFCVNAKLWCKIEQKYFKAGAAQAAAAFSTKITALRGDVKGGGVSLRSSRLLTFRLQPVSPACGRQRTPPTVRELRSSPAAFRSTSS